MFTEVSTSVCDNTQLREMATLILLAGDFNACIATNSDFVPLDNSVHLPLPPDYTLIVNLLVFLKT